MPATAYQILHYPHGSAKMLLWSGGTAALKIVRIVVAYFLLLFACSVVVVTALGSWSDGAQTIFAFGMPALLIWWWERRRDREPELDEFFEDEASLEESPTPMHAPPSQDNAALVRAGQTVRTDLAVAARRIEQSRATQRRQGWIPNGEAVTLAGRTIDGMIYLGAAPATASYGQRCRAYIDPALPVAASGTDKAGHGMSYWPGYSSIPPVCRATYLDWLAGGRCDGSVNPGYMFLFFYGVERRFLVDQPGEDEKREILEEAERLRELFSTNHSVQRYLGEFIDLARIAVNDTTAKEPVFDYHGWELPLSLKVALGGMIASGSPLTADWLLSWFLCHFEKRLRTPAHRCRKEFQALFGLKFDARYPDGLRVQAPKALLRCHYRAASGEFGGEIDVSVDGKPVPDIAGLRKPITIAQEIADEAMDELDKFSRFIGRNPEGNASLEGHALLPRALREQFPSEEMDRLKTWAREQVERGGYVLAADVVARLEGGTGEAIGKRQLTSAADALARMGFGMAPDPRFSLRGPRSDEPVVLFELGEAVEALEDVSALYRGALVELALGTFIAHADKRLVEAERSALKARLASMEGLTELERKRLNANLDWLVAVPPDMTLLRSRLKEAGPEQQTALRAAVVAIAHADGIIQSEEVVGIEKVYRALGLDPALVYSDLHAGEAADGPVRVRPAEAGAPGERIPDDTPRTSRRLDAARIAAIRSDTERVSSVLGEIFATEEAALSDAPSHHALPPVFDGLDAGLARFVEAIVMRDHWEEAAFSALAASHGLLTSGALEAVNEWAFERFDEALLDAYEGYDVAPSIAEAVRQQLVMEVQ